MWEEGQLNGRNQLAEFFFFIFFFYFFFLFFFFIFFFHQLCVDSRAIKILPFLHTVQKKKKNLNFFVWQPSRPHPPPPKRESFN